MNARRNQLTSKALVILSALLCAQLSWGQNPWEEGRNVSGEAVGADLGHSADAFIGGSYTSGEFRDPSDAKTAWVGEVSAEAVSSYKTLYMKGNFGFELFRGSQMMGSMFVEPGFYPIDVLEFTPGTKVRQNYDVGGGLAWKNGSRWTPGGVFRFRGVNYAKRKDLRHTTYRQEMEITPSIHYKGDLVQFGLSGIFESSSEFIIAEQVGQARSEPYMAFLDKGLRYGTLQVWDASGTHLKEPGVDRLPVKELKYGAAFQTSIGELFYGDVEYTHSDGLVGEKGYNWFRFQRHIIKGKLIFDFKSRKAAHRLRTDIKYGYMDNHETVLDKVTVGGVTTPREYGSNLVFRTRGLDIAQSYELEHDNGWKVGASAAFIRTMDLSTLCYPYFDDDRANYLEAAIMGEVPIKKFVISSEVTFTHLLGSHWHFHDDVDKQTGVITIPYRLEEWKKMEDAFTDSTQFSFMLSLRYNIGHCLYAEAGCTWRHAFNVVDLPGCDRQTTYIKFGYNF